MKYSLFETTVFFSLLKRLWNFCDCAVFKNIGSKMKILLDNSVFGNTFIKAVNKIPELWPESNIEKQAVNAFKKCKERISFYLNTSQIYFAIKEAMHSLYIFSFNSISIILFTAILTNIAFAGLFYKEIRLSGWAVRAILLAIAFLGMMCKAQWNDYKESSFMFRHLKIIVANLQIKFKLIKTIINKKTIT